MTNESILKNVKLLVQMHTEGLLGGETMPEDALIGVVPEDELLNVLTLGMSLNYQTNSYKLWQSVAEAYLDDNSRWIFTPRTAAGSDLDVLRDALLRHRVGLQPNRHPEVWKRVAGGIARSLCVENVSLTGFPPAKLHNISLVAPKVEFITILPLL